MGIMYALLEQGLWVSPPQDLWEDVALKWVLLRLIILFLQKLRLKALADYGKTISFCEKKKVRNVS